ncbi:MAG: methyl-accepting chemotaxis protein [Bacillota bacterium]|nr:methyl-accepting chemotaxis protein [Bacillota bacterium]
MKRVQKFFRLKGIALKLFIPVTLMVLLLCFAFTYMVDKDMNNVVLIDQENNLKAQSNFVMTYLDTTYPGAWTADGDKLYKGSKLINDDTDIVDLVSNRTGYYCTLFLNDVRVCTSVKANGKRATGTKASAAVVQQVLKGAQDYAGFANVAGAKTLSYYIPLKDSTGKIIGMFFLGNNQSSIGKVVNGTRNKFYSVMLIAFVLSMFICLTISFYLSNKIRDALEMIEELSKGHLGKRLKVKSKDEIGKMSLAMNELADTLQNKVLVTMDGISQGNMSSINQSEDAEDQITPVLKRTSDTVRSIVQYTNRIIGAANDGDLTKRIDTSVYEGSWKQLTSDINTLMDSVAEPIEEVRRIMAKVIVNDYTDRVNGDYNGIFKDMADETNNLCKKLLMLQNVVDCISKGDTSDLSDLKNTGKLSENDNMTPAIIKMMTQIQDLINEVDNLANESVNGNVINARGNAEKFEGGYRKIVEGFNNSLEAISNPLTDFMRILSAMAVNDYTFEITEDSKGDYATVYSKLTSVKDRLASIEELARGISKGDISELENYKIMGKISNNDILTPSLTQMMESIQSLIDETTLIANSAANGDLKIRGDVTKFDGGYAAVISSVNDLLSAVEMPINEVTENMTKLSQTGKLDITLSQSYKGKFKDLSNAYNYTFQSIKKIIGSVTNAITQMSKGNFSIDKMPDLPGDYQALPIAINLIIDSLNELLGRISETSEQVAAGSTRVLEGSQMLSDGASEQASSVEELTASVTQISAQTRKNAEDAVEANRLADTVKQSASSGNSNMNDMLQSMSDIGEASSNISKIIKVIDDIAFQTNILALNAAVEAARAGQYGKGFAVVAGEVRSLAAKSAEAAKETTDLIEGTVRKVSVGTEIANKTADALSKIVTGVDKVSTYVNDISTASNEQALGIAQIDQGLQQVSQVIQTISETSEESASASDILNQQADLLKKQVSKFQLKRAV